MTLEKYFLGILCATGLLVAAACVVRRERVLITVPGAPAREFSEWSVPTHHTSFSEILHAELAARALESIMSPSECSDVTIARGVVSLTCLYTERYVISCGRNAAEPLHGARVTFYEKNVVIGRWCDPVGTQKMN